MFLFDLPRKYSSFYFCFSSSTLITYTYYVLLFLREFKKKRISSHIYKISILLLPCSQFIHYYSFFLFLLFSLLDLPLFSIPSSSLMFPSPSIGEGSVCLFQSVVLPLKFFQLLLSFKLTGSCGGGRSGLAFWVEVGCPSFLFLLVYEFFNLMSTL